MSDKQMERFEGMLTQLVTMVGHLREDVDRIRTDVDMIKTDVDNIKTDLALLKQTQEKQHAEVIGKLELMKVDHEITWSKTVENEREIERIKKQVMNN